MSLVTVLFAVIFGGILHFTRLNMERESVQMMRAMAFRPIMKTPVGMPNDTEHKMRLPFFTLTIDENGEITSQKEVSIADIVVDDLLLVKPGEKIPVDGDVVGGESYVDESMINGEPIPKVKKDGEEVFAGTINQDGVLYIKAKKIGKVSFLFG